MDLLPFDVYASERQCLAQIGVLLGGTRPKDFAKFCGCSKEQAIVLYTYLTLIVFTTVNEDEESSNDAA